MGHYLAEGNTADLLFVVDRRHWGHGLATELALAALATAFRHPEVAMVYATVHPANQVSLHVLEKCGLTFERQLPERNRLRFCLAQPPATG